MPRPRLDARAKAAHEAARRRLIVDSKSSCQMALVARNMLPNPRWVGTSGTGPGLVGPGAETEHGTREAPCVLERTERGIRKHPSGKWNEPGNGTAVSRRQGRSHATPTGNWHFSLREAKEGGSVCCYGAYPIAT